MLQSRVGTECNHFEKRNQKKKKNIQASTRFEPRTSGIPAQRSNKLNYEGTVGRAGHFGSINATLRSTMIIMIDFIPTKQ